MGVDVSKDTLDFAICLDGKWRHGQIANQVKAIRKWLQGLDEAEICLVLEPTGTYHSKLLSLAFEAGIGFILVNPRTSYHYSCAEGHLNRNDPQAARSLASYAMRQPELKLSVMPSQKQQQRKQLHMALKAMDNQKIRLQNQIHALEQLYRVNPTALKALESSLAHTLEQIELIREELHELEDEEERQLADLIQTIVGIGPKSTEKLLLYLGDFSQFDSAKQVLKFAGVAPGGHRSGTSVKTKDRISKRGPTALRATLYIAARSARRYNYACKELYTRLREKGKPHKLAMIAVVAKLLRQVFAVVNSQKPFENEFYLKYR